MLTGENPKIPAPEPSFPPGLLPWVTVICTVYNHQNYVVQALQSVLEQTYSRVELIVIDNSSSDDSSAHIRELLANKPSITFIPNVTNFGLNRAFNQGLALAKGTYIVDLAADDLLLPDQIAKQVALFEQLPDTYGVVFSNAAFINEAGQVTGTHYPTDSEGHAQQTVPSGDVFSDVLASYFICTPTMMMRRTVLDALGGYDESLSYEDFDFWVRSSRTFQYAYLDEILTHKRLLPNAMSAQVMLPDNTLLASTLVVCRQAFALCAAPGEFRALAIRLRACVRKAFYAEQFPLACQFGALLRQIEPPGLLTSLFLLLSRARLPVNRLYRFYRAWKN